MHHAEHFCLSTGSDRDDHVRSVHTLEMFASFLFSFFRLKCSEFLQAEILPWQPISVRQHFRISRTYSGPCISLISISMFSLTLFTSFKWFLPCAVVLFHFQPLRKLLSCQPLKFLTEDFILLCWWSLSFLDFQIFLRSQISYSDSYSD